MRDFKQIMKDHRYWKDNRWNSTDSIYTFETGSQIEFFSVDNGDKLRGARRDRGFLNEANNCPFDAFTQTEVRTKEFYFLDWNPTVEFWYYTEVKGKRDDVEELTLTYKQNEALDRQIIASIEQRKNNKSWWRVYGQGLLGEIEGKIYKNWQIIDDIPHEARLVRRWIDFGYTNDPTSIGDVYQYNGGYILDEIAYEHGMSNKAIADVIKLQPQHPIVIADSAEPKSIDEIKSYGITILPSSKGPGSVNRGIAYVQDQQISLTKRSVNTIKEYRNYIWLVDKDGKILNEEDPRCANHSMSGIRYALDSLKPIPTEIKIQQERVWQHNQYNQQYNSAR